MNLVEFVTSNPIGVGQLAFSVALVLVTVVYTFYTAKQTKEMQASREMSNQPVVKGDIGHLGPVNLLAVVKNTGNGAAHNVSTKLYFDDVDVDPVIFKTPVLAPGEEYEFGFPLREDDDGFLTGMDQIESLIDEHESRGILHVETTCENAFGDAYCYDDEIDVLDIKENLSQILYDDETTKMRKAVEGIESNLGDVEDNISQEYTDALAQTELYERVLEEGRTEGSVTFIALKNELGVERRMLSQLLRRMKMVGLVEYPDDVTLGFDEDVELTFPSTA